MFDGVPAGRHTSDVSTHYEHLAVILAPRSGVPFIGPERGRARSDGIARFDSPHGSRRYVLFAAGEPLGAAQFVQIDPDTVKLANVFVHPAHRRAGVARQLVAAARRDFRTVLPADDEARSAAGDRFSRAVFGRNAFRPNRLVQFDRGEAEVIADAVLDDLDRELRAGLRTHRWELDEAIRDAVPEGTVLLDRPFFLITAEACSNAYEPFFLGGGYTPRQQRIDLQANACRTIAEWLAPDQREWRRRSFLDVYLHELTHSVDRGVRQIAPGYARPVPLRPLSNEEYVNLPAEVKAYARNVFEETTRSIEMLLTGKAGAGNLPPETLARYRDFMRGRDRLVEHLIVSTPSWRTLVRAGLTADNQQRILRDTYLQLEQDGWLERLAEVMA